MKITAACDKLVTEMYEKAENISLPKNRELESWVKSSLYGLVDQVEVIRRDIVDGEELDKAMLVVDADKLNWLTISRNRVGDLHTVRREYREVMKTYLDEKMKQYPV